MNIYMGVCVSMAHLQCTSFIVYQWLQHNLSHWVYAILEK